jgi:hypothetical protein
MLVGHCARCIAMERHLAKSSWSDAIVQHGLSRGISGRTDELEDRIMYIRVGCASRRTSMEID